MALIPRFEIASQLMVRIVPLSRLSGDGRAIHILVPETWEMPLTAPTALSTVSLPVQGTVRTMSPVPAPSVTM